VTPLPEIALAPPARAKFHALAPSGHSRAARGESLLWLCGGALALCVAMVVGLLLLVLVQGATTFWPTACSEFRLRDGSVQLGEITRSEDFAPGPEALAALPAATQAVAREFLAGHGGRSGRVLVRTGNFELTGEHFRWLSEFEVATRSEPAWAVVLERQTWGRFYGTPTAFVRDGKTVASDAASVWREFEAEHAAARARFVEREALQKHGIGRLSDLQEEARLAARAAELRHDLCSEEHLVALARYDAECARGAEQRQAIDAKVRAIDAENARCQLVLTTCDGRQKTMPLHEIVRAYAANQLSLPGRLGVYFDRWREFLLDDPRESNSEGGVWPAIFGTVLMTLLMSLCVVPLGVLAALYMREYAKAGLVISAVRIAVNNLAGVPSIVFGVFGLGFFCYIIGGSIDSIFYPERLPSPTFGKGAMVWAALTLALLTLPVVIVATEEALAAVPGSMREGSYACGASKWQTIRRIVLPRAMPGIMTGAILAMARGAGEVAPLMLVGAVKLAPELPLDTEWPLLHPSRSFMHLGFHIYDLGFQSQNSEASRPMVFTTTLLLITTIVLLNVVAVRLRSRLRTRFVGAQF
jgi:phosphate transport system permease protein